MRSEGSVGHELLTSNFIKDGVGWLFFGILPVTHNRSSFFFKQV